MADSEDVNPERVGIRMDVLKNILTDLENNDELKGIFGEPVAKALVVVADNNDLRIEDGGMVELKEEHEKRFLAILDDVIRANSM